MLPAMKTKTAAILLVVLVSMIFPTVVFSDNPPKKEQDKEQNTTGRVFTIPFVIQNEQGELLVLSEGDYSIWVFDENGDFLFMENRHLECFSVIPNIPKCKMEIWPSPSLNSMNPITNLYQ